MSNLILKNNNNYYFKSDKISVYPCAYRGSNTEDDNKYFDPASRYTSEKNLTGAVVGLIPNGTYISDIPLEISADADEALAIWKFTIGGYNFEAQLDADDLSDLSTITNGKAVLFEIKPEEPSDLAGLGAILTSLEGTTSTGVGTLDKKFTVLAEEGDEGTESFYCFTGLKVTVLTTITTDTPIQPTPTELIPVLYKSEGDAITLVLNQCARLPEITHGNEEGEIEVAKLTVDEAIVENTDTTNLVVENQLIVGADDTGILKVAQNSGNPTIEINEAPIIINQVQVPADKAPITVNVNSTPVTITASSSDLDAIALSVDGNAEVKKDLTVTNKTATGTLSVASGNFVVDSTSTTIKNALTVKNDTNTVFGVNATDGNTIIAGTLDVAKDFIINPGEGEEDLTFKVVAASGDTTVTGTLDVASNTTIKNNLTVQNANGTNTFTVESATGNTAVAGTLSVGPNNTPYLSVDSETTTIYTNNFKAKKVAVEDTTQSDSSDTGALIVTGGVGIGGKLNVAGDLSVGNIVSNLIVKDGPTEKFKVELSSGKTTINGALEVTSTPVNLGNNAVVVGSDSVTIDRTTQVSGVLKANGGLQVVDEMDENIFSVNTNGELTAKSVTADTLNVPYDTGHTSFSLKTGDDVVIDGVSVPTKIFQFGGDAYTPTPTIAKAQLLNMIYPVGSIYMTMATSNPGDLFGGTWKQISQGRVLLGAGSTTDAGGKTGSFTTAGADGGYYDPQSWTHSHNYNAANSSTGGCTLKMNHLPRKDFKLRFYVAESGGDKENILRWCGKDGVDGVDSSGITDAPKGSHARLGGTQVYSGNDAWHETEGFWNFHYGDGGSNAGEAHNHVIEYTQTNTDNNPETNSRGNLPPYSVCYIWQRTE